MANLGFNPTKFITKADMKNDTQVAWKAEQEGKVLIVALGESSMWIKIASKSEFSFSPNFVLDVLISDFNKMNSFAYDLSYSSEFECLASNNDKIEETIPKDLIRVVEDHENLTFITEDTIVINVGTPQESREIQIGKSLSPKEQKDMFAWSCKGTLRTD